MLDGLLPIGSVIMLKNTPKKLMIVGIGRKEINGDKEVLWDYSAVGFPEGFMSADRTILFNNESIERVLSIGYQDEEQFEFKKKADALLKELRAAENNAKDPATDAAE